MRWSIRKEQNWVEPVAVDCRRTRELAPRMVGPRSPSLVPLRLAMAIPVRKSVKFLSYNSTGMNQVKSQWVQDLMDTCDASYCGIQEHFKKIKTVQKYFKSEFPKCDSLVQPAYREEGRDTGRAQGGLLQLSLKTMQGVRNEKLATES